MKNSHNIFGKLLVPLGNERLGKFPSQSDDFMGYWLVICRSCARYCVRMKWASTPPPRHLAIMTVKNCPNVLGISILRKMKLVFSVHSQVDWHFQIDLKMPYFIVAICPVNLQLLECITVASRVENQVWSVLDKCISQNLTRLVLPSGTNPFRNYKIISKNTVCWYPFNSYPGDCFQCK